MSVFQQTLIANIALGGGIVAILYIIKFFKKYIEDKVHIITAITVGLLLALVFLGFIPELTKSGVNIGLYILIGIILFYVLELLVHWHHCHELDHGCSHHHKEHQNNILIFTSTLIHNMLHGIVLFAAFSSSFTLGIATTIGVFFHSIPQNIANYLLSMKNEKLAYIAAIGGIIGILILFPFSGFLLSHKAIIISIIAGGLLYTALADILPEGKNTQNLKGKLLYFLFILVGIGLFILIHYFSKGS